MTNRGGIFGLVTLAVLALAVPATWAMPQTTAQQKCINKVNKDGVGVQKRQGKISTACVKSKTNNEFQGGSPTATEDCVNNDLNEKLISNEAKTTSDDAKYCGTAAAAVPEFGHTDAVTVNNAAVTAERALIHDVFGANLDANLFEKDPNANEANCQRGVHKRVEQFSSTIGRVYLKCKKNALATEKEPFPAGAASAAELQTCVLNDFGSQFAKRTDKILDWITGKCDPFMVSTTSFPGVCNALSGMALRDCLVDVTECRVCEMLNAMDNLAADCDTLAGTTCP